MKYLIDTEDGTCVPVTETKGSTVDLMEKDKMTSSSSKHVGFCETTTSGDTIRTLGGNQDDSICMKKYNKKYLYAVYRPEV